MRNNLLALYGISPEEGSLRWKSHRLEQLLVWAGFSFEQKVQSLEEMEETAVAFGNRLDPSTGRLCPI